MSYILDALRKSDQQRQRGTAPTLMTVQAMEAAPVRSGLSVNGWLAAVILIGTGMLIGWLRPWQTESPTSTPEFINALAPNPAVSAQPHAMSDADEERERQNPPAQASMSTAAIERAEMASDSTLQTGDEARSTSPLAVDRVAPQETMPPMPEITAGQVTAKHERENEVIPMNELPVSIRQEISSITISFHVYASNPAERRVMINNELLRQGDSLSSGLGVERITVDGVVLSYKGHRFQRGVR